MVQFFYIDADADGIPRRDPVRWDRAGSLAVLLRDRNQAVIFPDPRELPQWSTMKIAQMEIVQAERMWFCELGGGDLVDFWGHDYELPEEVADALSVLNAATDAVKPEDCPWLLGQHVIVRPEDFGIEAESDRARCPYCKSHAVISFEGIFRARCLECYALGPPHCGLKAAWDLWNTRAEAGEEVEPTPRDRRRRMMAAFDDIPF